jgi:hypothetical protein
VAQGGRGGCQQFRVVVRMGLRERMVKVNRRWLVSSILAFTALLGTGSCSDRSPGNGPTDGPLPVQYTVDLLSIATEGHARVRYREPDGTMTTERVILPWRSDILVFRTGDLLVLEAKTLDHLDHGEIASLQCEVLIDPGNPEGKAAGSSRANMCDVRARARTSGVFSFPD